MFHKSKSNYISNENQITDCPSVTKTTSNSNNGGHKYRNSPMKESRFSNILKTNTKKNKPISSSLTNEMEEDLTKINKSNSGKNKSSKTGFKIFKLPFLRSTKTNGAKQEMSTTTTTATPSPTPSPSLPPLLERPSMERAPLERPPLIRPSLERPSLERPPLRRPKMPQVTSYEGDTFTIKTHPVEYVLIDDEDEEYCDYGDEEEEEYSDSTPHVTFAQNTINRAPEECTIMNGSPHPVRNHIVVTRVTLNTINTITNVNSIKCGKNHFHQFEIGNAYSSSSTCDKYVNDISQSLSLTSISSLSSSSKLLTSDLDLIDLDGADGSSESVFTKDAADQQQTELPKQSLPSYSQPSTSRQVIPAWNDIPHVPVPLTFNNHTNSDRSTINQRSNGHQRSSLSRVSSGSGSGSGSGSHIESQFVVEKNSIQTRPSMETLVQQQNLLQSNLKLQEQVIMRQKLILQQQRRIEKSRNQVHNFISKRLSLPADLNIPVSFIDAAIGQQRMDNEMELSMRRRKNNNRQTFIDKELNSMQQEERLLGNLLDADVPLSRSQRRVSLMEIGFGKKESYNKLEELGKGTYATVYKGRSSLTKHLVALKEIRLEHEEGAPCTAIREISLLKGLKHNNVITLHDIVYTDQSLTLVFEYLPMDLNRYMIEYNFLLHSENVRNFLFQILRGLAYIHSKKILHRDLKPQNLLITKCGVLKIADFGLARAKTLPINTFSSEVVTLWYRPPDVLSGSTDYNYSIDMWGVGCIFFEMATGRPLFPGSKPKYQLSLINKTFGLNPTDLVQLPIEITFRMSRFNDHAYDLMFHLMRFEPNKRITAEDAMRHIYFGRLSNHKLKDNQSIYSIPGVMVWPNPGRPQSKHSNSGNIDDEQQQQQQDDEDEEEKNPKNNAMITEWLNYDDKMISSSSGGFKLNNAKHSPNSYDNQNQKCRMKPPQSQRPVKQLKSFLSFSKPKSKSTFSISKSLGIDPKDLRQSVNDNDQYDNENCMNDDNDIDVIDRKQAKRRSLSVNNLANLFRFRLSKNWINNETREQKINRRKSTHGIIVSNDSLEADSGIGVNVGRGGLKFKSNRDVKSQCDNQRSSSDTSSMGRTESISPIKSISYIDQNKSISCSSSISGIHQHQPHHHHHHHRKSTSFGLSFKQYLASSLSVNKRHQSKSVSNLGNVRSVITLNRMDTIGTNSIDSDYSESIASSGLNSISTHSLTNNNNNNNNNGQHSHRLRSQSNQLLKMAKSNISISNDGTKPVTTKSSNTKTTATAKTNPQHSFTYLSSL